MAHYNSLEEWLNELRTGELSWLLIRLVFNFKMRINFGSKLKGKFAFSKRRYSIITIRCYKFIYMYT